MDSTVTLASQDLGMIITFRDISVSELRKVMDFNKKELWDWLLGDFFVTFEDLITDNEIDINDITLFQLKRAVEICSDGAIIFNQNNIKKSDLTYVPDDLKDEYISRSLGIGSSSGSDDYDYAKDWSVMAYKA